MRKIITTTARQISAVIPSALVAALILFGGSLTGIRAQDVDAAGSEDHRLIPRMDHIFIHKYDHRFDRFEIRTGPTSYDTIEGLRTSIFYMFDYEKSLDDPSAARIIQFQESAVQRHGGKYVYHNDHESFMTLEEKGREIWVRVLPSEGGASYALDILEVGAIDKPRTTGDLYQSLRTSGSANLEFHFADGSSELQPEDRPQVDQIIETLDKDKNLSIAIEVHGNRTASAELSKQRAHAIRDAITEKGIGSGRVSASGLGSASSSVSADARVKGPDITRVMIVAAW